MTEYDYSPEAYERYLSTQSRIARWVENTNEHTPANPFHPLPGEHGSVNGLSPRPASPSYRAYHVDAQRLASPTYTSQSGTSGRHRQGSRRYGSTTYNFPLVGLPSGGGFRMAKQAQLAQPISAGMSAQNQLYPFGMSPHPSPKPAAVQGIQVQYPYRSSYQYSSPALMTDPYSRYRANNIYSNPADSSSSVQSLPLSTQTTSGATHIHNQTHQSVMVPLNGGGCVVVPPGQRIQVIPAQTYRSDDSGDDYSQQSFFGTLRWGRKKANVQSRKNSRKENVRS